jgi:hypothetical protein
VRSRLPGINPRQHQQFSSSISSDCTCLPVGDTYSTQLCITSNGVKVSLVESVPIRCCFGGQRLCL